ncbi:hypothetical protein [Flammeovirga aprica]|uniref:Uncharacterized protein n=1 Tax=Flammeovirga aprica JL-4 TaxID=694437 RepID=A0A7X9S007_9BACT|nr:hypothetical protein [Flammeovirga aprica]NME71825.1 hypothetical protein [Flammeovirga aprica JL-4]
MLRLLTKLLVLFSAIAFISSCSSSNDEVLPDVPGDDKVDGIEGVPPGDGDGGTDKGGDDDTIIDGHVPIFPGLPPTDGEGGDDKDGEGDIDIDIKVMIGYIEKRDNNRNVVYKVNQPQAIGEATHEASSPMHQIIFSEYKGIGGSGGRTIIYNVQSITGNEAKLISDDENQDILYLNIQTGVILK